MPYSVNGQMVVEDQIRAQETRLQKSPEWNGTVNPSDRAKRLRVAAELAAIDATPIEQLAANDSRSIDSVALGREVENQRRSGNICNVDQELRMREWIERQFRVQRIVHELAAGPDEPTTEEIESFYQAQDKDPEIRFVLGRFWRIAPMEGRAASVPAAKLKGNT
jgi:hypothetical protein